MSRHVTRSWANRRRFLGVAVATGLALSAAACASSAGSGSGGSGASGGSTTYGIGLNDCLTGTSAQSGVAIEDGLSLAVDAINKEGLPYTVRLDVEDSDLNPSTGVTVFTDETMNKHDGIVFSCGTAVIQATVPLAAREQVVEMNTAAGGTALVNFSPWLFNEYSNDSQEIKAVADYAYNTLHIRRLAVNVENDSYGQGALAVLKPYWANLGGSITVTVTHDQDAANEDTQVAKIAASKGSVDGIFDLMQGADNGVFIKEARAAGLNQTVLGTPGMVNVSVPQVAGSAADGTYYATIYYNLASTDAATKSFVSAYRAKYGNTTVNPYIESSYEGVMVWNQAVQYMRAHNMSYNGANLRKVLLSQKFTGLGETVTFPADQIASHSVVIGEIKNQKFTNLMVVKAPPAV
jgi:branched-chain amino acid transport system substrate-binding protein